MASERQIETALIKQLKDKGYTVKTHAYLFDKVADYMALYRTKENLVKDIEERGVAVSWKNSETSCGVKQNDSVAALVKVDMQMLKILTFLDLKPFITSNAGGAVDGKKPLQL